MTITLNLIDTPNGGVIVLPSHDRVTASIKALTAAAEKEEDLKVAEEYRNRANELHESQKDIRDRFGDKIRKETFEFEPYTYGQKLEAERQSTVWENSTPRLDGRMMDVRLVAAALKKTEDEVLALPPAIVPALAREIVERSEPDQGKLDFFFTSPTSSGETQSSP